MDTGRRIEGAIERLVDDEVLIAHGGERPGIGFRCRSAAATCGRQEGERQQLPCGYRRSFISCFTGPALCMT